MRAMLNHTIHIPLLFFIVHLCAVLRPSMAKAQKLFGDYLDEYNDPANRNPHMSLVFFQSAVDHISRISRILRQPRGNSSTLG